MQLRHSLVSVCAGVALLAALAAPSAAAITTLNIEIDWMKGANGHTHKPNQCELDAIKGMFSAHGITVNFELSDEIPETAALLTLDFNALGNFDGGVSPEYEGLEAIYRDHAVGSGWHYCIFAHNYALGGASTSSSGLAEISGDEFVVTLASFTPDNQGTAFDRAGTLAHEFGHNLSLRHAGNQNENIVRQYKPNYPSLMAYRYQLIGVKNGLICQKLASVAGAAGFKNLDYSNGTLASRDENSLEECAGIGLGIGVDWNCDAAIAGCGVFVAKDVSSQGTGPYGVDWCGAAGTKETITDYNDWGNIVDVALAPQGISAIPVSESCITKEEADEFSATAIVCPQPDPCDNPTNVRAVPTWGQLKSLYR